jgi:hypothetical protein
MIIADHLRGERTSGWHPVTQHDNDAFADNTGASGPRACLTQSPFATVIRAQLCYAG